MSSEVSGRIPGFPPRIGIPEVLCPTCGRLMWLTEVGPSPEPRRADISTFQCRCGTTHAITVDRPSIG